MRLTKTFLVELFNHIKGHDIKFTDTGSGVLLRHDVDDDFRKSVAIAELEAKHGVKSTFFILNTAPYWRPQNNYFWLQLREMQQMGHEIAWHNNAIAEWLESGKTPFDVVSDPLNELRSHGLNIRGSASHGDKLCHVHGFINYEIFAECPRTREAVNFKKPVFPGKGEFPIGKLCMGNFGLEYEAYHVPYDRYYSESGGAWRTAVPTAKELGDIKDRVQILIHPQWWEL